MDYKLIKLTKGKVTEVDPADFGYLNQWRWHYNNGYAVRKDQDGKTILMHRLLLDVPNGMFTDHINRHRLDNRRSNLRLCTQQQNNMNTKKKGVIYRNGRWCAQIMKDGKNYAKNFIDKIQATNWYNQKARELHGDFAVLLERSVL